MQKSKKDDLKKLVKQLKGTILYLSVEQAQLRMENAELRRDNAKLRKLLDGESETK